MTVSKRHDRMAVALGLAVASLKVGALLGLEWWTLY